MKTRKDLLNILLWLASIGSMIGIMTLLGRLFEENNFVLLIEFVIITVVTLFFFTLFPERRRSLI